ncbi:replicative DNA helicase [Streptomyces europaeiscabiei]|uniref:replicative DNA helicase n=1 Tax=Streptomyces europaeiscabiei TaxID=146819 RepID=UPI00099D0DEF|nr:DnaB-like helicase C-terminal domain-containing protein [Streptomyces europaeiscabiei]MDX3779627.1 DnaB-like helicase C-terminal domain-containing protein [Streptomyces europaeiscabiei]
MPSEELVPPGPHRQLLDALHQAYAAAGRPGLRQISTGIKHDNSVPGTVNYQAIGKILNGKQLPNPRQLVSLTSWLLKQRGVGSDDPQDLKKRLQEMLAIRDAAHDVSLGIAANTNGNSRPKEARNDVNHSKIFETILEAEYAIERQLLSCMLRSKEAITEIVEPITPETFTSDLHREIYGALLGLYADSQEISCEAVAAKVASVVAAKVDVPEYLSSLLTEDVNVSDAAGYAAVAIRIAQVKLVASLGSTFTDLASRSLLEEHLADADELLESVTDEVFSFVEDAHKISSLPSILVPTIDEAEGIGRRHARQAIPSGLSELDTLIEGFRPGEFVIVGGASGIGKSTLGLDFARSFSLRHSRTTLLVSLQMSQQEMAMRIMSAEGRVSLHRMRSAAMEDEDWKRLNKIMPTISQAPLYMKDDPLSSFRELEASCEWLSSLKELRLVVIDSIDLMEFDTQASPVNPENGMPYLARELRKLARRLDISIVALFQTERPNPDYRIRSPRIDDIPGSLEKYADTVILLHREDAYDRESPRAGEADIVVAKNRSGLTGVVTVAFQGHYARFVSMTPV